MSELRRERQRKRLMPDFGTKVVLNVRKHWLWIVLVLFGPEGIWQVIKRWAGEKFVDWLLETFGSLGIWLLSYKFGVLTFSLVGVVLWLVLISMRDTYVPRESLILDAEGKPYQIVKISRAWNLGLVVIAFLCVFFAGYGVADYYHSRSLLNEYPLGYVIFKDDYATTAVTPVEARRGLEQFSFDFRPVRIIENTPYTVSVRLPDILRNKKLIISGTTGGTRRVGHLGGAAVSDDKGKILEFADILAIEGTEITFLVGFQREPPEITPPQ